MAILSKAPTPDNFESQNSLKLSFTNIHNLRLNFVESESFPESSYPDIITLCETNLDDSIYSANFSVRGYLPLIRKYSVTRIHGLAVYVKEGRFLLGIYLQKSPRIFIYVFDRLTSFSVLLLSSLLNPSSLYVHSFCCYFIYHR